MANPWFRLYWEMLDDPKIGQLTDSEFRAWVSVMMVQCAHGDESGCTGMNVLGICWRARLDIGKEIVRLADIGLLDIDGNGIVHVWQWAKRQFKSDNSTERVRKHRERLQQQIETVTETFHVSDSEENKEKEQKQKQIQSSNVTSNVSETFQRFWDVVSKKVGKAEAFIAFKKLNPDDQLLGVMISSMTEYAKKERQYQKDPVRWIKGRRWEDELVPEPGKDKPLTFLELMQQTKGA